MQRRSPGLRESPGKGQAARVSSSLQAAEGRAMPCAPRQPAASLLQEPGHPGRLRRGEAFWAHTVQWLRVALLGPTGSWAQG